MKHLKSYKLFESSETEPWAEIHERFKFQL